jgi:hypothetical protein
MGTLPASGEKTFWKLKGIFLNTQTENNYEKSLIRKYAE